MYRHFADVYDNLMQDVDYDAWATYLYALARVNMPEPLPVTLLECACGTGNITLRLAQKGVQVTGSDLSPDMLRVCGEKARRQGLRIPLVQQDMRYIQTHKPMDAICCCCDGVNYLTKAEDVSAFFASAYRVLKPGGLLLFDISTEYKLSSILSGNTFGEDREDVSYLWHNSYDPQTRLCAMELTLFIREGELFSRHRETHVQRAHSHQEMLELMGKNGFALLGAYDAFTREPIRRDSQRIQYLARKEDQ